MKLNDLLPVFALGFKSNVDIRILLLEILKNYVY